MPTFPPATAHGPLVEAFPDVFTVTGSMRMNALVRITRNMTVVRQGAELTLLNSVRLSPAGEAALEKLGRVAHLVRVGAFHGLDDPYYLDRYRPTYWAPPGTPAPAGLVGGHELRPGSSPIEHSQVFLFAQGRRPEAAVLVEREGGMLIPCDSYQHWTTLAGVSLVGKVAMRAMGFGPTTIGAPWLKAMGPGVRGDFARLIELPFRHLLPAHGTTLRDDARDGLRRAIARRFKEPLGAAASAP